MECWSLLQPVVGKRASRVKRRWQATPLQGRCTVMRSVKGVQYMIEHPEAFWAIPVLVAAGMWMPELRRFLRILILLCLVLAWANPVFERLQPGVDLWVLVDKSNSVTLTQPEGYEETERLLKEGQGPHDRLFLVDMAGESLVRDPESPLVLTGDREATRIGHAIQMVLSQRDPKRASRILLLGDGFATDVLDYSAERLLTSGVPLDVRLNRPDLLRDVRVEELRSPIRVRPGEPFVVDAELTGPAGETVSVLFLRDGQEVNRQDVTFTDRGAEVRWAMEVARPGATLLEVQVEQASDPIPGNNRRQVWVQASGGSRLLLISAFPDDPIARFLRREVVQVDIVNDPSNLTPGALAGTASVWIHNVHAAAVPRPFLDALDFFVREQGGGLVMVGGKSSFGSGGYHESPIDELLPVSMELKEEDRKLSIAIAIVMDRSGSMAAGVAGGRTKMDLANAGAAQAIELMGESDSITVFAVDTQPHTIVPLSRIGGQKRRLAGLVRRIQSAGGGIYVFNGLEAAWNELKNSTQDQRHIILFSDAADSEQPEGVSRLIKEMRANNTTVSVIALGSDKDPDAPFLEQIAEEGEGRLFFNADASTLPSVFAQETVSVSRSAFLEDPVGTQAEVGWRELAATFPTWPTQVDGYNLSYLREEASQSLRTTDEYAAPLIAHWQRGVGNVAAVSMPLGGPFSQEMRAWPELGDFVRTLHRWVKRQDWPPGLALRTRREGDVLRVSLLADEEWQTKFALTPPVLRTAEAGTEMARTHPWRRMEPGHLRTDLSLEGSAAVRGVVRIGRQVLPFGPVSGQPGSEWQFPREAVETLTALSVASGGSQRTNLSDAWIRPPQTAPKGTRLWWLWACAGLFLFEAFWSRTGGKRLEIALGKKEKFVEGKPELKATAQAAPKTPPSEEPPASRRSMFDKAKR